MADVVNEETRSRIMSSVRSKNTRLEVEIRRRIFMMGFRYRLHVTSLPGTPDLVFPKHQSVVFIHGCFWHLHGCHLSSIPATRQAWWKKKLEENADRDSIAISNLKNLGWRILIIWECSIRKPKINRREALDSIAAQAKYFLESKQRFLEIPRLQGGVLTPKFMEGRLHGQEL